jgi:hypothetical protein
MHWRRAGADADPSFSIAAPTKWGRCLTYSVSSSSPYPPHLVLHLSRHRWTDRAKFSHARREKV